MKLPLSTIIFFAILGCVAMARETPKLARASYGSPQALAAYKPTLYRAGSTHKPNVDVVLSYAAKYLASHPDITEEQLEEEVKLQFPAKRNLPHLDTFFGDYIDLIRL